jgi:hypothetical protein
MCFFININKLGLLIFEINHFPRNVDNKFEKEINGCCMSYKEYMMSK